MLQFLCVIFSLAFVQSFLTNGRIHRGFLPVRRLQEDEFVDFQKEMSRTIDRRSSALPGKDVTLQEHLTHQERLFDEISGFFASDEATPAEVVPLLEYLVQNILKQHDTSSSSPSMASPIRILDIGCGTGALFPFYVQVANQMNISLDITGVDLSASMLQNCRKQVDALLSANKEDAKHSITLIHSDFVSLILDNSANHQSTYDTVVSNACFANFYDMESLVDAMTFALKPGTGSFFITHPLGASFVEQLHRNDPRTVPHVLPSRERFQELVDARPLDLVEFQEQVVGNTTTYLASAKRCETVH